ncbi:MAG: biotin synthase BioB [Candidatus Schekmanbacteria bacterium RIFCSPHIGHO2_02_FULL_38_11]|uniref:Biotin synthase n=1 Tax=Candidatus Schekmanbacteria bacterium RIFCSPLOWO2_12_FULL_38_15 TaxID=1817883 RepID=A0A1F7SCK4_9BACT|nr:MAG: biotin synthase BioB [Candidatus Schekmanbacteria bacterium GWA2_38_9]OGL48145.1 MAG: biotin synthase BioB [Candidatus Schekmanbacteria bacterium RIFCSPHIGHO2_02_FULL_38_11]OGL50688.1 MAG: biotin synthase BioB [Candidatus Schekmanbacteria bacterium RIFCSPLOWO2_02_FULL_38_14]OGL51510.1 MAG: biotin synthase BioB [Candidatus Schekmanbacteria bacterium RIFCSPLOWO2_12_FULL_38_15]
MKDFCFKLKNKVLSGGEIYFEEALELIKLDGPQIFDLLACANWIRHTYKKGKIIFCSIVNAKCGGCSEDCAFCSQSVHYQTNINSYPLLSADEIVNSAKEAFKYGATEFSIVTSGRGVEEEKEISRLEETFSKFNETLQIPVCASLGFLDIDTALRFKKAGLENYHHNLETSESFFKNICSTHSYRESVETVRIAKKTGFRVCSGGIFGMGETLQQRVELAFTLRELDVDCIPMNFLNPIPGTPLENMPPMKPLEILKTIAVYRFILQQKDIIICGGREINLRDLQSFMFVAGANGTMLGNYLTTKGRAAQEDMQMIKDLELEATK